MQHDVFLSHASEDASAASALSLVLEQNGVQCWIAPRDVPAGAQYSDAILDAISHSRVLVVLLSEPSVQSPHVVREVERAVSSSIRVLPVRIADVKLSKSLQFFLSSTQWFDAFVPPLARRLEEVAGIIVSTLAGAEDPAVAPSVPAVAQLSTADVPPVLRRTLELGHGVKAEVKQGETHCYLVPANAGDVLIVRLHDLDSSPGQAIRWEPVVQLCTPERAPIAETTQMVRARLGPVVAPSAGPLLLFVSPSAQFSSGGHYNLFVQRVNDPGFAKPLLPGQQVQAALDTRGDVHTYVCSATDGDRLKLTMTRGTGASGRHLYPWLEVFDPAGRLVESIHSHNPVGEIKPARVSYVAHAIGTFTVLAGCYLDGNGAYTIGLELGAPEDERGQQRQWFDDVAPGAPLPAATEEAGWVYVIAGDARMILLSESGAPRPNSVRACSFGERLSVLSVQDDSCICMTYEDETGRIDSSALAKKDPKQYFRSTILGREVIGTLLGRQSGGSGKMLELSSRGGTIRIPVSRIEKLGVTAEALVVLDSDGNEHWLDAKEWAGSSYGWPASYVYGRWPSIKSGYGIELRLRAENIAGLGTGLVLTRATIA